MKTFITQAVAEFRYKFVDLIVKVDSPAGQGFHKPSEVIKASPDEVITFLTQKLQQLAKQKDEEFMKLVEDKRKEVWRFYHEAQLWTEQKQAVKPYDEILAELRNKVKGGSYRGQPRNDQEQRREDGK